MLFTAGLAFNFLERRAAHDLYSQDIAYQRGDPLEGGAPAFDAYDDVPPADAPVYYRDDGYEYADEYEDDVEPSPTRDPGR
ncbi:MAG: hypothetical protein U5Q44_01945 [Dehalococcoidia bacterium]|nr:hypothetical protein [Dehalococcoidia bacterium]